MNKSHIEEGIKNIAEEFGYNVRIEQNVIQLSDSNAPLTINFDISDNSNIFVYLFVRFSSWDAPGERTDLNEFYTLLFSSFMRIQGNYSCTLMDVPHPAEVPETEVYARYMIFGQPNSSVYQCSKFALSKIKELIGTIWFFNQLMPQILDWSIELVEGHPQAQPEYSWDDAENWATNIADTINEPVGDLVQYSSRKNPTWKHYRSIATSITVFEAPTPAQKMKAVIEAKECWKVVEGITGKVYLSTSINNYVSTEAANKIHNLLSTLENSSDIVFIPLENKLVGVSNNYIACIETDCSIKAFEIERSRIQRRHENERCLLFPVKKFTWSKHLNDEQFELLVLDLLKREHGVVWARKVSGSNERDGGRDVISEWKLPIYNRNVSENIPPASIVKIIVQAKAFARPLGKSNVPDIRDTVEHFDAQGYLLVTSNYLTTTLTDHLERERSKGKIHIDWWTRSEIEDRLRQDHNSDLLLKYPDILFAARD